MVNEQKLREKINNMGYKLKSDNGSCFHIKGYPESTSFKTLEEVEKWVNDKVVKDKLPPQLYIKYDTKIIPPNKQVSPNLFIKNTRFAAIDFIFFSQSKHRNIP